MRLTRISFQNKPQGRRRFRTMKLRFFSPKTALLLAGVCAACAAAHAADAPKLRVGVAKVDITPKDLTGLVGIVPRPYGGVHDELYARALVVDNGTTNAAIVALDLVEMGDTTALRQRIE